MKMLKLLFVRAFIVVVCLGLIILLPICGLIDYLRDEYVGDLEEMWPYARNAWRGEPEVKRITQQ